MRILGIERFRGEGISFFSVSLDFLLFLSHLIFIIPFIWYVKSYGVGEGGGRMNRKCLAMRFPGGGGGVVYFVRGILLSLFSWSFWGGFSKCNSDERKRGKGWILGSFEFFLSKRGVD